MTTDHKQEDRHVGANVSEIKLGQIECVSALARHISEHSELLESPTNSRADQQSLDSVDNEVSKLLTLDEVESLSSAHVSSSEVNLIDLFKASQRTMLFGDTNVGKSFFAQELALSISSGAECFCFSKSKPAKVVYLDGEMGDTFVPRLKMLCGCELNPLVKQNLKVKPLRGEDVSVPKNKEHLINELESFLPSVVFIDNIISLFDEAVKGRVDPLKLFVETLEKNGIAVVLVHHTSKSAETYKGPIELAALCQNVIHLKSRAQIVEAFAKEDRGVPPRMAALMGAKDVGPLVSMSFSKCKICPELEKETHYYYLPINGQWTSLNLDEALVTPTDLKNVCGTGDNPNPELTEVEEEILEAVRVYEKAADTGTKAMATPVVELTDEQQQVLEAAKKSPISNKVVRNILNCSESKATNILCKLCQANYLRRTGQGPTTKYYLSGILNR